MTLPIRGVTGDPVVKMTYTCVLSVDSAGFEAIQYEISPVYLEWYKVL